MPQAVMRNTFSAPREAIRASHVALSVAAGGLTEIFNIPVQGLGRIFCTFAPTVNPFDQFVISAKPHPDGSFVTIYSAAIDFTAPSGILVGASGDLTALAAGSTGWFIMDVLGLDAVKIEASAGVGAATVAAYLGGS